MDTKEANSPHARLTLHQKLSQWISCKSKQNTEHAVINSSEQVQNHYSNLHPEICTLLADFPNHDPKDTVLHVVFRKLYSEELIIEHLLKSGQLSNLLSVANSIRDLPLHVAMRNGGRLSDRMFDTLVRINPEAIRKGNIDEALPIHIGCAAKVPSIYAIRELVKSYPESLQKQSDVRYSFKSSSEQHIGVEKELIMNDREISDHKFQDWCKVFSTNHAPGCREDSENHESRDLEDVEYESNLTPLHIAILNCALPEVVECLLHVDQDNLEIRTSRDRTALDCAKFLVNEKILSTDSAETVKNSFAAIDLIMTKKRRSQSTIKLLKTVESTTELIKVTKEPHESSSLPTASSTFDAKAKWKQLKDTIHYANVIKQTKSELGPRVIKDSQPAVCPVEFEVPKNLDNVTMNLTLPVGFLRLRLALCRSKSPFLTNFLRNILKNTEFIMDEWDKFNIHIGSTDLPNYLNNEDFIGATRKYQWSKSSLVSTRTAYATMSIVEYNDHCFAYKVVTNNPDVTFGKKYELHSKVVCINCGDYMCRIVCSMETVFPESTPLLAWKIRDSLHSRVMYDDVAFGEFICENAGK